MLLIFNTLKMNKTQSKEFRMFDTTLECLSNYQSKWEPITAIGLLKEKLGGNIALIRDLNKKKSSSLSNPVTAGKDKTKELLEESIEVLGGIVISYAEATGQKELLQKAKLLTKSFARKRETDIEPKVTTFLYLVRELQPQLGGYALTEDMLAEAETLCSQFVSMVGAPRKITVQSSSANSEVDNLVSETKKMLTNQLDNLMLRFRTRESEFYNAYCQARSVVEPASHPREKQVDEQQPT